jgi:predicted nucleotidyltransferase
MLDFEGLRRLAEAQAHPPLFVTVSGAHLYGFPSPDSDIDLRGAHLLPLRNVIGLSLPNETVERKLDLRGVEVELVSHDLGKYLRLLVKNNGYILEQIFSPLVVSGADFIAELRPLAERCVTRYHYHHYRGFFATQRGFLAKQEPKVVKTLLYSYRVLLTGIHLLRTGEVEAYLPRLAEEYGRPFLADLIAQKREEKGPALGLDWPFHDNQLNELESLMDQAFRDSTLPEDRDRQAINRLLVERRLSSAPTAQGVLEE